MRFLAGIIAPLLILGSTPICVRLWAPSFSPSLPVHNIDSGLDYPTIGSALLANETLDGHTIRVDAGTYTENIFVNKTISLIGEDPETTVIDGGGVGTAVAVVADNFTMSGFTVRNNGIPCGISLSNVHGSLIQNNAITNCSYGILLESSTCNTIQDNNVTDNDNGIQAASGIYPEEDSCYNTIIRNQITNNGRGVFLEAGLNNVSGNNMMLNTWGINIMSHNNRIVGNNIAQNWGGIGGTGLWVNYAFHNNFVNNERQVYFWAEGAICSSYYNDTYPSGGNYWSDYNGTDTLSGVYQNQTGGDGMGDTPYVINSLNRDDYPLMGMFSSFNTSLGFDIDIISDSTIEDCAYFESNSTITLHVSNMTVNQKHGFVRINIPHTLMSEPYNVTVDGGNPTYWNYTLYDNGTHRWIYFTYEDSIHEIVIIPEFQLFLIIPIFIIATLPTVIICRKKHAWIDHI